MTWVIKCLLKAKQFDILGYVAVLASVNCVICCIVVLLLPLVIYTIKLNQ